ncbi:MAG TPA: CpsB/CapC family capsule biosynthesis tyrosine phosphatase [Solirubrobacteraceae bacterium]|nr:CpsB/CapC family capsule biosynthesis tyrosine phosphatase [Solirubrobacteraceae bacterium]
MAFVETHFHLLPGLDDGPADMQDTIELARAALADGTGTIIATPHVHGGFVTDVTVLPERVEEVRAALCRAGVQVSVLCGGELAHPMVPRLTHAELELIAHGPPGRRWLLLEAPLDDFDSGFTDASAELRRQGFGLVIAHPERALAATPEAWPMIEHELSAGAMVQLNAWSLLGHHGAEAADLAAEFIQRDDPFVLASDAHGPRRPPSLRRGLEELASLGHPRPECATRTPQSLLEYGFPVLAAAAVA